MGIRKRPTGKKTYSKRETGEKPTGKKPRFKKPFGKTGSERTAPRDSRFTNKEGMKENPAAGSSRRRTDTRRTKPEGNFERKRETDRPTTFRKSSEFRSSSAPTFRRKGRGEGGSDKTRSRESLPRPKMSADEGGRDRVRKGFTKNESPDVRRGPRTPARREYGNKKSTGEEGARKPYSSGGSFERKDRTSDRRPNAPRTVKERPDAPPPSRTTFAKRGRNHEEKRFTKDSSVRPVYNKDRKPGDYKRGKKDSSRDEQPQDNGLIRLNRYISNAGICSRREADKLITAGLVTVNGKVVNEMGYQVKQADDVRFNGERLSREKKIYILMNKPKDAITTLDDPDGRNTVMDILGNEVRERVFPVGRLDRNTTGVLILTNDGELSQRLMHPKYEVQKVYKATLNKVFKGEDFWQLTNGVELEDGFIKPDEIAYPDAKNKSEVGVQIHSGRNRIIHRMFESLGYLVDKLDRVAYGDFVKARMKRGEWRYLDEKEIKKLKRMAKLA